MRKIDKIIIHCSATGEGREFHAADIDRWHKQQGWNGIGYHYVVLLNGKIEEGRSLELPGAHCKNHNFSSVGICYVGGLDSHGMPADTRTPEQRAALLALIRRLKAQFPKAKVYGHRDFAAKDCPCFNAREEYANE